MNFPRRKFLKLAAGAAAFPVVPKIARAQAYPARPVRVVVGFPPGGVSDLYARLIAQWLSDHLGQQFIVDNRTGAGGSIATEAVTRATADGYTLLLTGSNDSYNTALYDNLSFDYVRDIAPVALFVQFGGVVVVPPSSAARTIPELIAYAKANPGKVTMASGGVGSSSHVFWELFRSLAGIDMVHVPYRGEGPALTDLLGGQVQVSIPTVPPAIEYIRAGKLVPLAVTTAARYGILPDVPVLSDFVRGFEADGWIGVGVPRGTPANIVNRLNREINAALIDPRIKSLVTDQGGVIASPGSPDGFGKLVVEFTDKWAKVIRAANIKPG
jgi:tripartite-type tricarboxylate transporter receptor subunit TctC